MNQRNRTGDDAQGFSSDKMVQKQMPKGRYSVKSGYEVAAKLPFWKLKVLFKITVLLWKIISDSLPCKHEIEKEGAIHGVSFGKRKEGL